MYAESKVQERLAIAKEEFGFDPADYYHSPEEVDSFNTALQRQGKFTFDDTGKPNGTQELTPADREFILHNQVLLMCDAVYGLTRFCWVKNEENIIERFRFRIPQRLLFDIICDLEERDAAIEIMILKARQLGMCLDPDTKVLTSNLEWKRIDDIQVGEELVSVDEHPISGAKNGKKKARRMRTARVEQRMERIHDTMEIKLDTGRTIIATPEHPFLCGKRYNTELEWRRSGDICVGDEIRHIVNPWSDGDKDDYWLGGLIDGEGCLRGKNRAGVELSIAQVEGAVLDRARKILEERCILFREEIDNREPGTSSKLGKQKVHKLVVNQAKILFHLLGKSRPTRFIGRHWWDDRELPGKKIGSQFAKVISVSPAGKRRVVNIQTSTGTFVAEGVISHNTTLVQLLIALRIIFSYGVNAVTGSADQQKTGEMSRMLLFCYDMLPCWLRPQSTSRVESERGKLLFGHLASGVSFQHGAQKLGIATGSTPTIYHLSEVALYTDPVKLIDEGLWKAVHASPSVLGILESTGRGNKGWWAETWYYSKANWPHSRMCPLFLPWFCGVDIYPKPAWLRMRPIPKGWLPNRDTRLHIAKCELYVQSHPQLARHLAEYQKKHNLLQKDGKWHMPREQQWFWEVNHDEAKAKNEEPSFLQEMAGDDEEALQRSVESVFGHDTIEFIDAHRERTYTLWGITGQSIEDRQEPPEAYIDYKKQRIPVRFDGRKEGQHYRWEFVPLKSEPPPRETSPEDVANNLIIFHHPERGVDYSIGVDTSEGKGLDSTVISVWSIGRKGQPDIQCAELASPYINHVEVYAFAFAIAAYYGQYMGLGQTKWPMPYLTVEQVEAVGDVCQGQMMRMGYPVSAVHKFVRLDSSPKRIAMQKRSQMTKPGWYSHGWSRPILTGNFVAFVQNNWAEVNSPWLLEEMKEYEVHYTARGKEKMEHSEDSHDDRIMAAAMAVFCPQDLRLLAERAKNRYVPENGLPPIDLGEWRGNFISTRTPKVLSLDDVLYPSQDILQRFSR